MSSFTEQQVAFLRRWIWENANDPGEAFAIATSHGFSFANMAILAAHAAVERNRVSLCRENSSAGGSLALGRQNFCGSQ